MENKQGIMSRIWNVIDRALEGWSILIMGIMAVLVVVSVFFRYVFNLTYVWYEEAILLLFIGTTYFGVIVCVKEKEHIDIPYFREKAPEKLGFVMDLAVCLINISIQLFLAYISINWIKMTGSSFTAGLKIPYYYIYSLFPLSFTLMAVYTIRRFLGMILDKIKNRKGVI